MAKKTTRNSKHELYVINYRIPAAYLLRITLGSSARTRYALLQIDYPGGSKKLKR
jgi:hypothetical protein